MNISSSHANIFLKKYKSPLSNHFRASKKANYKRNSVKNFAVFFVPRSLYLDFICVYCCLFREINWTTPTPPPQFEKIEKKISGSISQKKKKIIPKINNKTSVSTIVSLQM